MFDKAPARPNFPQMESDVIAFWKDNDIIKRAMKQHEGREKFTFFEGPPTANGRPHPGHILTRVMKDVFLRYRAMCGFDVLRKAGWDTHGLPVELEVERELGLNGKDQIEQYGVEAFVKKCRESVFRYEADWRRMTERIGFWVDMDDPYITCANNYIESVWWILKSYWEKDMLYRGHKIVPHCPRCDTALSSHEVAQGYKDVEDPSVIIRCPVEGMENTSFLVWTTTPWTLLSNVALALGPDVEYAKVKSGDEFFILADARVEAVIGEGAEVVERFKGSDLAGKNYTPPYTYVKPDRRAHYVINADFVSTTDGTGIVHIAPAFGEDDYNMGRQNDLPFLQPVDTNGKFTGEVPPWKGQFVKDADPSIIEDLKERGVLFHAAKYLHSYPFCWRCDAPLIYYARGSWFIRTTAYKDALLAANESVNWIPDHIKKGRMGDFLEHNIDWAVSRDRYWGTPLNLWICEAEGCDNILAVDSAADLKKHAVNYPDGELDLHKPWIDAIECKCEKCGGVMKRTPEVIDCWLDSGAMPVAQWHYPHENKELFESRFPADYITEAVDQTRGWFYSLLALSSFLFGKSPFKNCLVLGLVLDRDGQKMSKSKGNVVDPWDAFDKYGADAYRWYFFRENNPWIPTRFYEGAMAEVQKNFFLTLWNVYSFFLIYANIDEFDPAAPCPPPAERDPADRWILSRLHRLIAEVRVDLERYMVTPPARAIEAFVDDLSNWYVRRCRPRFWKAEKDVDKQTAYATLHETLVTLTTVMAPFTPFFSEALYRNIGTAGAPNAPESVHFMPFPESNPALIDAALEDGMGHVRDLVNEARALRSKAAIKVRQPLAKIYVRLNERARAAVEPLAPMILDELNVQQIEYVESLDGFVTFKAKPNLKKLGQVYGKDMGKISEYIRNMSGAEVAALRASGSLECVIDEKHFSFKTEDFLFESGQSDEFVVADNVALDIRLTPELISTGLAREIVHRIQNIRKERDFNYEARIAIRYETSEKLAAVIRDHADYIRGETLANSIEPGDPGDAPEVKIDGEPLRMSVETV